MKVPRLTEVFLVREIDFEDRSGENGKLSMKDVEDALDDAGLDSSSLSAASLADGVRELKQAWDDFKRKGGMKLARELMNVAAAIQEEATFIGPLEQSQVNDDPEMRDHVPQITHDEQETCWAPYDHLLKEYLGNDRDQIPAELLPELEHDEEFEHLISRCVALAPTMGQEAKRMRKLGTGPARKN